ASEIRRKVSGFLLRFKEFEGKEVCQKHLNEISRQYFHSFDMGLVTNAGQRCYSCAYPEAHSAKGDRTMSYQMSKNLLERDNILVPVGLPICDRHYKSIPKKPMERSGILHIDDANPERSGIRHVDDDPVSSEERDNQQHSENNDNGDGTVDDFCEDNFHDNNHDDDPNDEEYCPPKNGNEYTELESAVFSLFKAAKIDKGKCTKPFSEYTDRTKKNKARTVLDIMRIIIGVMTKTDEENDVLLSMVIDMLVGKSKDDENAMLHSLL
ncbi:hypothetical protein PENTCL1PPCAC_4786, partial [Pristionchus entomophagus]